MTSQLSQLTHTNRLTSLSFFHLLHSFIQSYIWKGIDLLLLSVSKRGRIQVKFEFLKGEIFWNPSKLFSFFSSHFRSYERISSQVRKLVGTGDAVVSNFQNKRNLDCCAAQFLSKLVLQIAQISAVQHFFMKQSTYASHSINRSQRPKDKTHDPNHMYTGLNC